MGDISVRGPDGRVFTYPEGTPDDHILSEMGTMYRSMRGAPRQPQAGDPTVMNSPVAAPRSQVVPSYKTPEDRQREKEALMLSVMGGGRAVGALQNTPGYVQRQEEAKEVGKASAKLNERQRYGLANLRLLNQIRATFDEADEDTQLNAIGPRNQAKISPKSPYFIPGTSFALPFAERPTTVDPQTNLPIEGTLTPVQRQAILNPKDEKNAKAWDLQNRLSHDIEGLTTGFITTSGGTGLNMSDSRQKAFAETIGAMVNATNPTQFHNIANDAENILREMFGLTMPQAASGPGIHPQAVQDLLKDTSARRRQQFDEIFGEGAAEQIIATERARRERMGR